MIERTADQNGGSRAKAAASDHHVARPTLKSVSEPSCRVCVAFRRRVYPGSAASASRPESSSDRAARRCSVRFRAPLICW